MLQITYITDGQTEDAIEEEDLELLKEYYYKNYTNQKYHEEALTHDKSYLKMNGAVFGGNYDD